VNSNCSQKEEDFLYNKAQKQPSMWEKEIIVPIYVAFCYSFFLFLLHDKIHHLRKWDTLIININAGLVFTYIFLTVFPDIFNQNVGVDYLTYFFVFMGFIGFYIAEKHTFALHESTALKEKAITIIRTSGFYILHFITGYLIVYTFAQKTFASTILLLIPFTFYIVAMVLLYDELQHWIKEPKNQAWLFPLMIFVGAICALITTHIFHISLFYFYAFFGGTLLYLMTAIVTPKHKKGHLAWFIAGVCLYFVLFFIERGVL